MPISRMDMMTMVPKTNEATPYRVNQTQKPVHEQVVLSDHQQKTAEHNSQQTVRKANAENPAYRYDAKEKGNNSYSGKQKKNSRKKEEEKEKNSRNGSVGEYHIDITI